MRSNYNPNAYNTGSIINQLNALNLNHSRASKQKALPFDKVAKILSLPEQFKLGSALDNGGCFFDCIAQSLNAIHNTNKFNEKALRIACQEFYLKNTALVDKWNDMDAHDGKYLGNYDYVQFTEAELDVLTQNTAPIWGRANVEGRMLCQIFQLKQILVIEMIKVEKDGEEAQYLPLYSICTADGLREVFEASEINYDEKTPTLMNVSGSLHFDPILPVNMPKVLEIQKDEKKEVLANEAGKEKAVVDTKPVKKVVAKKILVNDEMTGQSLVNESICDAFAKKPFAKQQPPIVLKKDIFVCDEITEKSRPQKVANQQISRNQSSGKKVYFETAENGEQLAHEIDPERAMELTALLGDLNRQYIEEKTKELQHSRYHALYTKDNLFAQASESNGIREQAVMIAVEGLSSLKSEMDQRAVLGYALSMAVFGDEQSQAQLLSMLDVKQANTVTNLKL